MYKMRILLQFTKAIPVQGTETLLSRSPHYCYFYRLQKLSPFRGRKLPSTPSTGMQLTSVYKSYPRLGDGNTRAKKCVVLVGIPFTKAIPVQGTETQVHTKGQSRSPYRLQKLTPIRGRKLLLAETLVYIHPQSLQKLTPFRGRKLIIRTCHGICLFCHILFTKANPVQGTETPMYSFS